MTTLRKDAFAGTVVFLVALPLCLGIAQASGVAPFAGLLAGIIGGLVIALVSGSSLSVSGPAAGLIVIVVEGLADVGSFPAFLAAVLVAGAMQAAFGALKMGRFAAYVPSPVIKGMLAAIGLLLIIKQLPSLAGLSGTAAAAHAASGTAVGFVDTPFGPASIAALGIGVVSLAMLFAWDSPLVRRMRVLSMIPAPLAVVALGIAATLLVDTLAPQFALATGYRVHLAPLDSLAAVSSVLTAPDLSALTHLNVWRLAGTLAIVASLETLLSLEAIERLDPRKRSASPDRELCAQGIGNMLAGLLGALPITAVIVRSSANLHAGAQTRASAVIHGVLLVASVFALTGLLNLIPLASLAAILIATGVKLAKPALFVESAKRGVHVALPFIATIVGVLATDLLAGIACGLAASAILALGTALRRPFSLARHGDEFLLSFRKDVSCFIKAKLQRRLAELPDHASLVVDAARADFVDPEVHDVIAEFASRSAARGVSVTWR